MCFQGEGIFRSNYFYGQDLPTIFKPCSGTTRSTYDAYCGPNPTPPLNSHDPPNYAANMCTSTFQAKITSILTIVVTFLTVVVGCILEITPLDTRGEVVLSVAGFLLSAFSIATSLATTWIMLASPLFSSQHVEALSVESAGIPFSSFLSCSFQMPLHSIFRLIFPGALECIFPGPAFMSNMLIVLVMGLSTCFYGISAFHVYTKRLKNMMDIGHYEHSDEEKGRKQRIYSLFGAAARRFSRFSALQRNLLIVVVPYLFMMSNAMVWAGFLMTGVQIIVGASVDIARMDYSNAAMEWDWNTVTSYANQSAVVPPTTSSFEFLSAIANLPPTLLLDHIHHNPTEMTPTTTNYNDGNPAVPHLSTLLASHLTQHHQQPTHILDHHPIVLFRDSVNVFNFSPTTSLSYFWKGGAYFVAIATFVAVFLVPIVKVLIWVWYFYVPSDEVWRGRVLTFQDFVGKYMLAQVLIIGWMGVAISVKRYIILPAILFLGILPPGTALRIHLVIGLNLGDGLGSWLFVLTVLLSLIIGQTSLTFHQSAFYWEEDRRVADAHAKSSSSTHHARMSGGLGSSSSSQPPVQDLVLSPYGSSDTPYTATTPAIIPSSTSVLRPSTTNRELARPLLRAIVEFGSSVDVAGMSHGCVGDDERNETHNQLRQPILNRIAQFGSRSNLAGATTTTTTTTTLVNGQPAPPLHPPVRLEKRIHPLVEAMCDRVHSPMHGVHLRWTTFGKALMLFFLFCLAGLTLATLSYEVCQIQRQGVIEYVTVPVSQWTESYSIISVAQKVGGAGYHAQAYEQQLIYVVFMILVPLARLLMLAYLWLLPLTVSQQKAVFDTLEIASAWSSLDVFWVVMIIMNVELEKITDQLTALQTPKVATLLEFFFGGIIPGGFLGAKIKLLPGFWLLTAVVILEKIVFYLVTEQAVTAISERQAETLLRDLAMTATVNSGSGGGGGGGGDGGGGMWSGRPVNSIAQTPNTLSPPLSELEIGHNLIADATQGLLETNAALFFSPAARYTFAPRTFYSGLPRFVWANWFVQLGLLADANHVWMYGSASPSSTHPPPTPFGLLASAGPLIGGEQPSSSSSMPLIVGDHFALEEGIQPHHGGMGGGGHDSDEDGALTF